MGNFSFDHILTLIRSRVGESGEFETPLKWAINPSRIRRGKASEAIGKTIWLD
jgi:hypothetical protein